MLGEYVPLGMGIVTRVSEFVDFGITVCGIEELHDHRAVGVTHVLSILDPGAAEPEAFGAYGEHERLDLRFHDVVDDLPGMRWAHAEDIAALLRFGRNLKREPGAHLLVHCQMGVSRSTAAMALVLAQARPDRPAQEALAEVARIRRRAWPNLRVIELGDALLRRNGEMITAARLRYGLMIRERPDIADAMQRLGRRREVDGAIET